jgi:hypothetical protein
MNSVVVVVVVVVVDVVVCVEDCEEDGELLEVVLLEVVGQLPGSWTCVPSMQT